MDKIEIGGKTFTAKRISALTFEKLLKYSEKLDELQAGLLDDKKEAEYKKCWLDFWALQVEGDIGALSMDLISPEEKRELIGFFTSTVAQVTKTAIPGTAISVAS